MYSPVTSRPLLALHTIESTPTHRGDAAYHPLALTACHTLSPGSAVLTRRNESVMRANRLSNDAPNAWRLFRLSRKGTTFAAVMSTKRRMPPSRCIADRFISSVPHA